MKYGLITFFVMISYISNAQSILCLYDSLYYQNIDSLADLNPPSFSSELNIFNGPDSFCIIKRYAYMVDKLYSRGLDLHSKLRETRTFYRDNTMVLDPTYQPPAPKPEEKVYHKVDLFKYFIEHKTAFEWRYYEKRADKAYLTYVNDLIKFGNFTHPNQVRDVLLFKYKALNKEKYYQDMRDQAREKRQNGMKDN